MTESPDYMKNRHNIVHIIKAIYNKYTTIYNELPLPSLCGQLHSVTKPESIFSGIWKRTVVPTLIRHSVSSLNQDNKVKNRYKRDKIGEKRH